MEKEVIPKILALKYTLNAYALKGYRLITDYPLFDKPTSREEFLDAFNVAMQFYEKKDS